MGSVSNICNIKVVGVGGGGNNAVNRMVASGITGAYFVAVNTDMQDLIASNADEVIQIGKELTKGVGSVQYMAPELLNNEDYELIDNTVRKTHSCELVMDVLDSDEFLYDNKEHQLTYDDGRLVY